MTELHNIVGIMGVISLLVAYLGLQIGRISATQLRYSVLNTAGAILIMYSLLFDFNLSAFVIECVWLAISIVGVGRGLRARRSRVEPDDGA